MAQIGRFVLAFSVWLLTKSSFDCRYQSIDDQLWWLIVFAMGKCTHKNPIAIKKRVVYGFYNVWTRADGRNGAENVWGFSKISVVEKAKKKMVVFFLIKIKSFYVILLLRHFGRMRLTSNYGGEKERVNTFLFFTQT